MSEAVGQVLEFGIGVSLSPAAVVAMVLLLAGPGGRTGAAVFIVTWTAALAVVAVGTLVLADGAGAGDDGERFGWVGVVQTLLGVVLVGVAAGQWRGRLREGAASDMPGWMRKVDGLTIPQAAAAALFLAAAKPKNLLLTIGAAIAIAELGVSGGAQAGGVVAFLILGTVVPAAPLVLSLLLRQRSGATLDRLRDWMVRENATIVAVLCLVFAAKLLGDGLAG